jgi:hypothetical protein
MTEHRLSRGQFPPGRNKQCLCELWRGRPAASGNPEDGVKGAEPGDTGQQREQADPAPRSFGSDENKAEQSDTYHSPDDPFDRMFGDH